MAENDELTQKIRTLTGYLAHSSLPAEYEWVKGNEEGTVYTLDARSGKVTVERVDKSLWKATIRNEHDVVIAAIDSRDAAEIETLYHKARNADIEGMEALNQFLNEFDANTRPAMATEAMTRALDNEDDQLVMACRYQEATGQKCPNPEFSAGLCLYHSQKDCTDHPSQRASRGCRYRSNTRFCNQPICDTHILCVMHQAHNDAIEYERETLENFEKVPESEVPDYSDPSTFEDFIMPNPNEEEPQQ